MEYPFPINIDKLIETIVYIANNVKHKTFLHIFKVFYLAKDRKHQELKYLVRCVEILRNQTKVSCETKMESFV